MVVSYDATDGVNGNTGVNSQVRETRVDSAEIVVAADAAETASVGIGGVFDLGHICLATDDATVVVGATDETEVAACDSRNPAGAMVVTADNLSYETVADGAAVEIAAEDGAVVAG